MGLFLFYSVYVGLKESQERMPPLPGSVWFAWVGLGKEPTVRSKKGSQLFVSFWLPSECKTVGRHRTWAGSLVGERVAKIAVIMASQLLFSLLAISAACPSAY